MKITDLARDKQTGAVVNPWREDLQPAHFRDAYFHVEGSGIEGGRRTVLHQFPKKNLPYTEDMGRRAFEFTVRGYCIQYPLEMPPQEAGGSQLYRLDYRIARDILVKELTSGEPGTLYLPTYAHTQVEIKVICPRYRLTEEERFGGYCVLDMTFQELGVAPYQPLTDPRSQVINQSSSLRNDAINLLGTMLSAAGSGPGARRETIST